METLEVLPVRTRVISILRNAILSGEFAAGEELSLTKLSEQLGVSRTPIREAFQMLEAEGLLQLRMNKGALVRGITEKTILDHYDMRELLESEAAARFAANCASKASDADNLKALQEEAEAEQASANGMEPESYRIYNQRFHCLIWEGADNQKLFQILDSLWVGPSTGRVTPAPDHRAKSIREHRQMLNAIMAGDIESARSAMKAHILRSKDNILQSYRHKD